MGRSDRGTVSQRMGKKTIRRPKPVDDVLAGPDPWIRSRDSYIDELRELTAWKAKTHGLVVAGTLLMEPAEYDSPQGAAILAQKAEELKQGLIASMERLIA